LPLYGWLYHHSFGVHYGMAPVTEIAKDERKFMHTGIRRRGKYV
jgi:hypothetical protein